MRPWCHPLLARQLLTGAASNAIRAVFYGAGQATGGGVKKDTEKLIKRRDALNKGNWFRRLWHYNDRRKLDKQIEEQQKHEGTARQARCSLSTPSTTTLDKAHYRWC